ncbi:MAG: response regulator transcription factor [Lachnospiraceae bacterium]|nr:response regulator transcription factor [Lachnospiraceae bacterium]
MYTVAFCDSDIDLLRKYERTVGDFFAQKSIDIRILLFLSGDELLEKYHEGKLQQIDLLFLEIEFPGASGIEVKNVLSTSSVVRRIIFLSNNSDYMQDAFGLKVMKYIKKTIDVLDICREIEAVYIDLYANRLICYLNGKKEECFWMHELIYIDVDREYTKLHFSDKGDVLTHHNFPYWKNKFKETQVVQIHRGFLVNLDYVKKLDCQSIMLKNGFKLKVGRYYYKHVKDALNRYRIGIETRKIQ